MTSIQKNDRPSRPGFGVQYPSSLSHSHSPPQLRKTVARPYQFSRLQVPSLPAHFKQISTPPVFRRRLPKQLSHCVTAFCRLFPYACVLLMHRAVQRECAPCSTFFRTPVSRLERREKYRSIFPIRVFPLFLFLILLSFQRSARQRTTILRIGYRDLRMCSKRETPWCCTKCKSSNVAVRLAMK